MKVLRDASGRATGLRVIRCEAKIVGGRLEIKNIEGTEEDIEADLIVSAIGQAVDFTGLESLNNGKGGIAADKNYQVQGQPGMFVGGDVVRPHLLTTAIGHGAIAADGIDRHLAGEALDKRPKIDVHTWDIQRKLVEKGLTVSEVHEPIRGTDISNAAIHNFDNRSDRYVIPHEELFLGHFQYTRAAPPQDRHAQCRAGAEQLRGACAAAHRGRGDRGSQALHELRPVLRVRQLRRLLPADGGVQGAEGQVDHRPLRRHRLQQVHRLPHLQGRVPDRLHPDGPRGVAWCIAACHAR